MDSTFIKVAGGEVGRHGRDFFGRFLRTFQAAAARQANCTLEDVFCVECSTLPEGAALLQQRRKGA
jgi:hypothetical protein